MLHDTRAGLRINARCQVVDMNGQVIGPGPRWRVRGRVQPSRPCPCHLSGVHRRDECHCGSAEDLTPLAVPRSSSHALPLPRHNIRLCHQGTTDARGKSVAMAGSSTQSSASDCSGLWITASRQPTQRMRRAAMTPVPVEVHQPPSGTLALARTILMPVLHPLATAAIIFVVTIFILIQQDDLRDRLIRLFGSRDLHRSTLALDDAARRLSRFYLVQLGVNAAFGIIIGTGL